MIKGLKDVAACLPWEYTMLTLQSLVAPIRRDAWQNNPFFDLTILIHPDDESVNTG
jgi:hypothetical protein